jgi:hypothetical protein
MAYPMVCDLIDFQGQSRFEVQGKYGAEFFASFYVLTQ